LETYVKKHPDATLRNISEYFGGSVSGAHDALARAGIAFKKGDSPTDLSQTPNDFHQGVFID
jgi:hypothetical protein